MVSNFREVVALWPSPDVLASEIGASVAAVRKWPQRGSVPAEWWMPILRTETARAAGLTAEVFVEIAARESTEARA